MTRATKPKPTTRTLSGTTEPPLSASAVAEMCGVTIKAVHHWSDNGLLEHFRTPGRHLRFRRDVVEAFVERGHRRAVDELQTNVVYAAVSYVDKQTATGLARLKKAVAALTKE